MKSPNSLTQPYSKPIDVPVPIAICLAVGILGIFAGISQKNLKLNWGILPQLLERNDKPLLIFGVAILIATLAAGFAAKGVQARFRRYLLTRRLKGSHDKHVTLPSFRQGIAWSIVGTGLLGAAAWIVFRGAPFQPFGGIPTSRVLQWLNGGYGLALFTAGVGIVYGGSWLLGLVWPGRWLRSRLPVYPNLKDGIVLGSIHEEDPVERPSWIALSVDALFGNVLKTGSIGSGKSQDMLRLLLQILQNFSRRPAILAIDPKRTFVREFYNRAKRLGLEDHVVYLSLHGSVRMNPIWRKDILLESGFSEVANTLKLASINFLGSSGDNRFWEQQSFHLLKYSLIYCGAKHSYFTFSELYAAIVAARDGDLAADLVDLLASKEWNTEEAHNINLAIRYFKNELGQMDEKIRTSILVTATGFLNEFQEYRVSRIFSPTKDEITFSSMADAIREGKLILLSVENEALARAIGTLLKLQFQEAVLARVDSPTLKEEPVAVLVIDEYQDVATSGGGVGLGDDRYLAKSREPRGIMIAATQSVSSLENAIRSEAATQELLQNFKTRTFGQTTDPRTVKLYQEAYGLVETEKLSQSVSQSAPDSGATGTRPPTLSEGFSVHSGREYAVTAKEFARLKPFEAFAQIYDGVETKFEKLFIKPYYLDNPKTPHAEIIRSMKSRTAAKVALAISLLLPSEMARAVDFPSICSVVNAPEFRSCLNLNIGACVCPFPPRPCARISYRVPQTFLEVWPNTANSFFGILPGAKAQLATASQIPFGDEEDNASYAFQARAIPVPLTELGYAAMPCGGTRTDKLCFDALSEQFGSHWSTGSGDSLQPNFLAWSLSPKACLLKGAAESVTGVLTPSIGSGSLSCGAPWSVLPKFPPSSREACNGWGTFYPRYGVYEGGSRSAAALMIAARLKSLGTEVVQTVPGFPGEQWQMIYPQSTSCFAEGQNLGFLETLGGVREERRILGRPKGYLFTVWKDVTCCKDLAEIASTMAAITALEIACKAAGSGGA